MEDMNMIEANKKVSMTREKFLLNSTILLSTLTNTKLFAQDVKHEHAEEEKDESKSNKSSKIKMAIIYCIVDAEECLAHCLELMGEGDKSLAKCARSTRDVIASCNALLGMLSHNSTYIKKMATLCIEVCQTCASECKKHAKHHKVCKQCMDSCNTCIEEMKKLT